MSVRSRLRLVSQHLNYPVRVRTCPVPFTAAHVRNLSIMAHRKPNITLYTDGTPNGIKISIALEELAIPYKVEVVELSKNVQKEPWFLEINPNGRIPALTDTFDDGKDIRLFESGSILQYLAEQYDHDHKISYLRGSREQYEVSNWLWFQNAGLGPMQGQANHFMKFAPEKVQYGIDRYCNETRRLYRVLEKHLESSKSGFLVGDHISIADITTVGWVMFADWIGLDLSKDFPRLKAWEEMLLMRPAVIRGKDIPKRIKITDKEEMDKVLQNAKEWIVKGMKDDAKA